MPQARCWRKELQFYLRGRKLVGCDGNPVSWSHSLGKNTHLLGLLPLLKPERRSFLLDQFDKTSFFGIVPGKNP